MPQCIRPTTAVSLWLGATVFVAHGRRSRSKTNRPQVWIAKVTIKMQTTFIVQPTFTFRLKQHHHNAELSNVTGFYFNDTVSHRRWLVSPSSFIQAWDGHGRRLVAEFGGQKKMSRTKCSNDFLGKNLHFNAQNIWWPFLVIDSILSVFCLSLLSEITYMAISWPKHRFQNKKIHLETFP